MIKVNGLINRGTKLIKLKKYRGGVNEIRSARINMMFGIKVRGIN
jgi:hypothetical protein